MALIENWDYDLKDGKFFTGEYFERPIDYTEGMTGHYIPAWSLHRLLCLYNVHYLEFMGDTEIASAYDIVIDAIEMAINGGYFSEKYLV